MYHVRTALFLGGMVSIAYEQYAVSFLAFLGLSILIYYYKEQRFLTSLILSFLVGFLLFMISTNFVDEMSISREIKIILNRLLLILMILAMLLNFVYYSKRISWYNNKPDWNNPLVLPFHTINTFWFWLIGIILNVSIYLFLVAQRDIGSLGALFLFSITFSLINAVLEELIWRGFMLSAFKEFTSTRYAIFVTSVGFGLFHLAIGFSIPLCLLISIAGVVYGVLTIKTNSIYPSIVFHFVVNMGMVFSGLIV